MPCERPLKIRSNADAADIRVTFEVPQRLPILERELRAIEVLLGTELQALLTGSTGKSEQNSR